MSFVDFTTPAVQLANEATEKDSAKEYDEALKLYLRSIEFFMTAIKRVWGRCHLHHHHHRHHHRQCHLSTNTTYSPPSSDEKRNPKKRDMLKNKVLELMDRAEQIKQFQKKRDENEASAEKGQGAKQKKACHLPVHP